MTDDLLERAASVVRERYDGHSVVSPRTEDLVLQRARRRSTPRRWTPLVAIPLAATLLASAAWGTATGKLSAALREVSQALSTQRAPMPIPATPHATVIATTEPVAPATSAAAAPAPATSAPDATSALEPVTSAQIVQEPALSRPRPRIARSARLQPSAGTVITAPTPAPDPEALFRVANRAQFAGHDPAAAVELWDHYLSAAPNGSLAPEARYNRAIALTQLGRKSEAAAALQPFARGDYGTYRQTEAQQLLKALGQ